MSWPHVTRELVDELVDELYRPGAFEPLRRGRGRPAAAPGQS
ncbi:hypothetical protein [Streptomyces clavuligerus]|nr:hypothetical protein [Streptomyces clavuligerus]